MGRRDRPMDRYMRYAYTVPSPVTKMLIFWNIAHRRRTCKNKYLQDIDPLILLSTNYI
jgi:hypothetical protein